MTRLTAQNIESLGTQLHKKSDRMQDSIDDFVRKDQVQDKHLKAHVDKIVKSSQKEINHKINENHRNMQEMNEEKFKDLEKSNKDMKQSLQAIIDKLDGKNPDEATDKKKERRGSALKKGLSGALGAKLGVGALGS